MIGSYSVKFLRHSEINENLINKIIVLKQQHWPHPYISQKNWINSNLNANDYHVIIQDSECNILAYLNLVYRKINEMPILGIGNVCVSKQNLSKGMGKLLMHNCKYHAKNLSLDLVLLCKLDLVSFYKKCGFFEFINKVYIDGKLFANCIMFSETKYLLNKEIRIDKSF